MKEDHKNKTPRDEEYVKAYLETHSQTKAAKICGVSRETVARAVRRANIPMTGRLYNDGRSNGQMKISDAQIIEELESLTIRQVAIKYHISIPRLVKRAKKLGVKFSYRGCGGNWANRAWQYGCKEYDNNISLKKLIERDKGICKICGRLVDPSDIENSHVKGMYPSLDHIIPLSKGGTHTWDNVQLAHLRCNAAKCDRTSEDGKHGIKKEVWT